MRICQFSLCDEAATVWFRGEAFCGAHALKRWGRRDVVLAARFSEIHRSLEASERIETPFLPRTKEGASSEAPSSGGTSVMAASVGGSLPASELPVGAASPPLSEAELFDILERDHWEEPWD